MTETAEILAFARARPHRSPARKKPARIIELALRSARAFAAVTAVLAFAFAAEAAHHEKEQTAPKPGEASKTGCFRQEDGGYICRYDLPKDYDPAKAAESKRMEVFEGCLRELYDSCRSQGGSRNCGWTAQLSCRSLSKPAGASG